MLAARRHERESYQPMTTDWLDVFLRAFAVIGMSVGAYQGYRQMRANGTWSTKVAVLQGAVLVLYLFGAGAIVVLYVLGFLKAYRLAALVIGGLYFTVGLCGCWLLLARIQQRFAPK